MVIAEATTRVGASAAAVFVVLEDLSKTPLWNTRCVEVRVLEGGPPRTGARLVYRYLDGRRAGSMDGEVTRHEPGRALVMRFTDSLLEVTVSFELAAHDDGTRIVHRVEILPRSLFMRLMAPMIRRATERQTQDELMRFKALVEAS